MATAVKRSNEYIPGMCNIGPAERRKRRMSGIAASIVGIALIILLLALDAPWGWRLFVLIPAAGAASGFLQDAMHFCAGFGMRGMYNVLNDAGITDSVDQAEYRKKDRAKAQQILGLSVLIGIAVTVVVILI